MPRNNPYVRYQYESEHFLLRQVVLEDAPDLLDCYSDPAAVALMNDDNCNKGFLCPTLQDMQQYIGYWTEEYRNRMYIRPVIVHKESGQVLGTMEAFGGEPGILRLDLRADWETPETVTELLALAVKEFPQDLPMTGMVTKAVPAANARREALAALGFAGPQKFRVYEDYYLLEFGKMRRELGIACCGLACCLCSENHICPGCQENGCPGHEACANYNCCQEKHISGCWECPEFPCGKGMHKSLRIQTFAKFAREHGVEHLLDCLEQNAKNGIVYHRPGGLTGDYDLPTEQEIFDLLEHGKE